MSSPLIGNAYFTNVHLFVLLGLNGKPKGPY